MTVASTAVLPKGFAGLPTLTIDQVSRMLGVHRVTVDRWRRNGVFPKDGVTARLKCVRIGCSWRTSEEEVAAFLRRLNETQDTPTAIAVA
jgi:excisionase family DNA binding protein